VKLVSDDTERQVKAEKLRPPPPPPPPPPCCDWFIEKR